MSLLEFCKPLDDVDLNAEVAYPRISEETYEAWQRGEIEIPLECYKKCSVEGLGDEGTDFIISRVGKTKKDGPFHGLPVFFRLGDQILQYISSHLDMDKVRLCNPMYPVWTDGEKVAKVIFSESKPNEYSNTIKIAAELESSSIPHPKILAHSQVSPGAAVVVMEYVGPDLGDLDSPKHEPNEEDNLVLDQIESLIALISAHGYIVDGALCNFCLKDGKVYAIDWADWNDDKFMRV
jgi:hypothetical protein